MWRELPNEQVSCGSGSWVATEVRSSGHGRNLHHHPRLGSSPGPAAGRRRGAQGRGARLADPAAQQAGVAVIAATVFASMAGFLDASVVNVAVPVIAHGPLRPSFPVGRASSILVTRSTAAFLVVALSGLAASSA
jgi:hypothetical protein